MPSLERQVQTAFDACRRVGCGEEMRCSRQAPKWPSFSVVLSGLWGALEREVLGTITASGWVGGLPGGPEGRAGPACSWMCYVPSNLSR